jgi:hypothetical protein
VTLPDHYAVILRALRAIEEMREDESTTNSSEGRTTNAPIALAPSLRERGAKDSFKKKTSIRIRSRAQVIRYFRIIITALDEVADYYPARHTIRRHQNFAPMTKTIFEKFATRSLSSNLKFYFGGDTLSARKTGVVIKPTRHSRLFLSTYER